MLRNKIGPSFDLKKVFFNLLFCSFFSKISFSLQKEEDFDKQKRKTEKLDQVLPQKKAIFGPSFDSTARTNTREQTTH